MSDEIKARLKEIESFPLVSNDIRWLIATLREQMARAEKAERLAEMNGVELDGSHADYLKQKARAEKLEGDFAELFGENMAHQAAAKIAVARAEKLEAACAAMRAALEWAMKIKTTLQSEGLLAADGAAGEEVDANFRPIEDALATDAGTGWASPELVGRAIAALELAIDRVEGEMAVGQLPEGNSIRPRYAAVLAELKGLQK